MKILIKPGAWNPGNKAKSKLPDTDGFGHLGLCGISPRHFNGSCTMLRAFRKKRRKYPVKRDDTGKSARQRCFDMFEDGDALTDIAEVVDVSLRTVYKYHQQWRKNPGLEKQVSYIKSILAKDSPDRDRNLETLASLLGTDKAQLETITHQPHGVRRLMTGKFTFPLKEQASYKQYVALQIGMLVSDHLVKKGGKFEDVYHAFERWLREYRALREDEEDHIVEENNDIALVRAILRESVKNERRKGVQPDRLSPEEREEILEAGRDVALRKAEKKYWQMIGDLIAGGLTEYQAREKLYQHFVEAGDLKGAAAFRKYQETIHPLTNPGQTLPPATPHSRERA